MSYPIQLFLKTFKCSFGWLPSYKTKCSWICLLVGPGGPALTVPVPYLPSCCPPKADAPGCSLLPEAPQFYPCLPYWGSERRSSPSSRCLRSRDPMRIPVWPWVVVTYSSDSTVSKGMQTVIITCPLWVLFHTAETSGPYTEGGVLRPSLLKCVLFDWAILQNNLKLLKSCAKNRLFKLVAAV